MQVQVRTDNHIHGSAELTRQVETLVEDAFGRFGNRITRVEVHLTDEASATKNRDDDKRCVMEARLAGQQPVAVTHHANTVEQALDGASEKLGKLLESKIGRLDDPRGHKPHVGE